MLQPVLAGTQGLAAVERAGAEGGAEAGRVAEGYAWSDSLTATVDGRPVTWTERRRLVRSLAHAQAHAQAAETALRARGAKAPAALAPLPPGPPAAVAVTARSASRRRRRWSRATGWTRCSN